MAIAAAAAVEAVEVGDGQVLERNGGQRRKAGQGWKCMPFIIGTYELVIARFASLLSNHLPTCFLFRDFVVQISLYLSRM
jgi:hypothetical protein